MATNQFLNMSDEEFLNASPIEKPDKPAEQQEAAPEQVAQQTAETIVEPAKSAEQTEEKPVVADPVVAASGSADSDKADPSLSAPDDQLKKPEPAKADEVAAPDQKDAGTAAAGKEAGKPEDAKAGKDPKVEEKPDPKTTPEAPDYEGFYKQIMTPFKANGRTIEPKSPEEAIRLMQMGANYGRKIQDMQPHLKTLRMLEKNNLVDPDRLSFLIEVNNKNPEAIKKIIKESGIDPLDLNTEDNVGYNPVNHAVSDAEVAFHEAVSEIEAQPTGNETLKLINQTWDPKSKSVLWESPQLLGIIQSQRDNGIYDQIVAEMERQKTFGTIPMNAPFLEAYKTAGDALAASNAFKAPAEQTQTTTVTSAPVVAPAQVIATRTETPKPVVANNDKASAASPSPSTARKAATFINPLNMADDEFLKQFNGRL
jgi:hypothetical protein